MTDQRLLAQYENDPEYIYTGHDGRCLRCRNVGPLFAMVDDDVTMCAECAWEWGWTVNAPDPLEYTRAW